jgi:molybdate transport system permease protein
MDMTPLLTSVWLSLCTTVVLLVLAFPVALFLGMKKSVPRTVVDTVVGLPLVLPPTVIGFYLLLLLAPEGPLGALVEGLFGVRLAFSFPGILIASVVYSFPFMVQPLKNGVAGVDRRLLEAAYTLGQSRTATFFRVMIPNMRPFILTGVAMAFAHTMGEFGVILRVGGNIPGRTRVASLFIYERVETLDYPAAHAYSIILLALSFIILLAVNLLSARRKKECDCDRH